MFSQTPLPVFLPFLFFFTQVDRMDNPTPTPDSLWTWGVGWDETCPFAWLQFPPQYCATPSGVCWTPPPAQEPQSQVSPSGTRMVVVWLALLLDIEYSQDCVTTPHTPLPDATTEQTGNRRWCTYPDIPGMTLFFFCRPQTFARQVDYYPRQHLTYPPDGTRQDGQFLPQFVPRCQACPYRTGHVGLFFPNRWWWWTGTGT